jgi:flagellar basal-body rod protein FlgF
MEDVVANIGRFLSMDVMELNVASQNVANLRTPGYRAETLQVDFADHVLTPEVRLDAADGPLQFTGRPLDVALQGAAFFSVERNGETLLTRAGQFAVDPEGRLTNAEGDPVLSDAGPIVAGDLEPSITANGEVRSGDKVLGRLSLVTVKQPDLLREAGGGLYRYAGPTEPWSGTVHVGALEQANVDPGSEMVRLVSITRHAHALQRAIQAYDEILQTGINRLGENGS